MYKEIGECAGKYVAGTEHRSQAARSTFTGCELGVSPAAEATQEGEAVFCAWQLTTYLKSTIPLPHAAPVLSMPSVRVLWASP